MTVPTTSTALPDRDEEIRRLLASRGRADAAAAVAHLSLMGTGSCIGAFDPGEGVSPMIEMRPLPLRGPDLLDDIAGVDENAVRLVASYVKAFPDVGRTLAGVGADLDDLETPALGWLLLAARLLTSLDEAEEPQRNVLGETVKLDTVVVEEEGRYLLDGRRLLRSLMSYRLADVEATVLSRSISESLGEFVATALARLVQDWPDARTVACAGDVFVRDPLLTAWTRQGLARLGRPVVVPH